MKTLKVSGMCVCVCVVTLTTSRLTGPVFMKKCVRCWYLSTHLHHSAHCSLTESTTTKKHWRNRFVYTPTHKLGQMGCQKGRYLISLCFACFWHLETSSRNCSFRGTKVGVQEEVPGCVTGRSPIPALGHAGVWILCCWTGTSLSTARTG